jgi:hypothetical protein
VTFFVNSYILKRALAYFFLTLFLVNSCGYYLLLWMNRSEIREQISYMIESGKQVQHLSTIHFSEVSEEYSILNDKEAGDEIEYNGLHFDIVKVVKSNGGLTITAINDKEEARLYQELGKSEFGSSSKKDSKKEDLKRLIVKDVLLITEDDKSGTNSAELTFRIISTQLSQPFLSTVTPPPQA